MRISTQPYKGSRDFYPEDMQIRNYIFSTWRTVCKRFGYEEYDGPFIESFDLYAAKTGEEIVGQQLYSFEDRGGRKVAIRPEMTPTVARMVAGKIKTLPRPSRWFSIPNLWRYEKPQKGRLREHFQLNADIFGEESTEADFEVMSLVIAVMLEFGATEKMFETRFGNRHLLEEMLKNLDLSSDQIQKTIKVIDKKSKVSKEDFVSMLKDAKLSEKQIDGVSHIVENPQKAVEEVSDRTQGAKEVAKLLKLAKMTKMDKYLKYDPTIVRGFDYYTSNVFELFDLKPDNSRSMCGGGRYDNLLEIFGAEKLPATGFGMGDVTMKNFLESWELLPALTAECEYLVTRWPSENEKFLETALEIANYLRKKGKNTQMWLSENTKLDKQLKYADKQKVNYAVIVGEDELKNSTVTIKNLKSGKQETKPLEKFLGEL
jgi:histidyl-tRNA synthetase